MSVILDAATWSCVIIYNALNIWMTIFFMSQICVLLQLVVDPKSILDVAVDCIVQQNMDCVWCSVNYIPRAIFLNECTLQIFWFILITNATLDNDGVGLGCFTMRKKAPRLLWQLSPHDSVFHKLWWTYDVLSWFIWLFRYISKPKNISIFVTLWNTITVNIAPLYTN